MANGKHAGRGEGSVYQRKDRRGKQWVASFIVEETGKRQYIYKETRREAAEALREALQAQKQGTLATGPKQTVGQYLEHWLENALKPPAVRISSHIRYKGLFYNHILPAFGHVQLQKLTAEHLERLYTKLQKEGYSSHTIRGIHGFLHKALNQAVRRNYIARNVCDFVDLPRITTHTTIQILDTDQAKRLLEVARGHDLEIFLLVAITTGMRFGELTALRWQDINFEEGTLYIHRTVKHLSGHGFVEGEPKTAKSKRKIMVPGFTLEGLKRQHAQQLEKRLKAGSNWKERGIVFPNKHGNFLREEVVMNRFHKLLEQAGLPTMRLHDLRHSAASILLASGVNPKLIQELLGHSRIGMTLDTYSHVMPSMQKEVKEKWNTLFDNPS
jgi:integrase